MDCDIRAWKRVPGKAALSINILRGDNGGREAGSWLAETSAAKHLSGFPRGSPSARSKHDEAF